MPCGPSSWARTGPSPPVLRLHALWVEHFGTPNTYAVSPRTAPAEPTPASAPGASQPVHPLEHEESITRAEDAVGAGDSHDCGIGANSVERERARRAQAGVPTVATSAMMRLGSLVFMDRPHTAVAQHLRPTPQLLRRSMRCSSGRRLRLLIGRRLENGSPSSVPHSAPSVSWTGGARFHPRRAEWLSTDHDGGLALGVCEALASKASEAGHHNGLRLAQGCGTA